MRRKGWRVLFLAILAGAGPGLYRQSPAVFSIANGFLFGYNLGAEDIGVATTVGFTFGRAESLSAGVLYPSGDGAAVRDGVFFVVDYTVLEGVTVSIQPGRYQRPPRPSRRASPTTPSPGPSSSSSPPWRSTSDYLTDLTLGFEAGIVAASLSVSFGLSRNGLLTAGGDTPPPGRSRWRL